VISAVVITRNEEDNIRPCLIGLDWCDEVVVVDDFSEDRTVKLAGEFGAKVYKRKLNNNFSTQRNFGLNKTRGEWVLFIDADEKVSSELAQEIQEKIKNTSYSGFLIKRKGIIEDYLLRFARRGSGFWVREVHETWQVRGRIGKLHSPILHSTPEVGGLIEKINKYSTIHALGNKNEGKKVNIFKIIFMPIFKFLYYFIVRRAYKEGSHGFVFSSLMSFHSFLAWSKQWENQNSR
jgi:glycosyltransferase involved in cell wall biosynthesis